MAFHISSGSAAGVRPSMPRVSAANCSTVPV
jgi:hypothetical protein